MPPVKRLIICLLVLLLGLTGRASRAWQPAEPYRAPTAPLTPALGNYRAPDEIIAAISTAQLEHHICKLQDRDDGPYCNEVGSRYVWHEDGQREARR
mgnify:CR=1 FL=1